MSTTTTAPGWAEEEGTNRHQHVWLCLDPGSGPWRKSLVPSPSRGSLHSGLISAFDQPSKLHWREWPPSTTRPEHSRCYSDNAV